MGDKHTSSNPSHPSNISRVHILTCLLLPGLWWWWESYPLPNIIHRQGQPQGHGPLWVWTEALWVRLHCGRVWTLYPSLENQVRVNFSTKSHSLNLVERGILFKLWKKKALGYMILCGGQRRWRGIWLDCVVGSVERLWSVCSLCASAALLD